MSEQRDHVQGPADAPVTLVEYGDYECPYCGQAYPVVKELQRARAASGCGSCSATSRWPRSTPTPPRAAEAAEAAGAQGKFWEMHDLLFEHQDALEDDDLLAYAAELGLDLDRFQLDLARARPRRRVREDFMSGVRSGVNGTPTFFINGRRHDGNWDLASLTEAVTLAASPAACPRRPRAPPPARVSSAPPSDGAPRT